MTHRQFSLKALGGSLAVALCAVVTTAGATWQEESRHPLALTSRISIAGTSNIHAYTATTDTVRVTDLRLADDVIGTDAWERLVGPGALQAFEIAIPAVSLSSPREGLDKNMHKALKVPQHPDIVFRLSRLEETGDAAARRAIGMLRVAGVEREVTLNLKTERQDAALKVSGALDLLMTDFGIAPPKAMLGMLKTDPKVTVTFETTVAVPTT
jgi:hypothetical protein